MQPSAFATTEAISVLVVQGSELRGGATPSEGSSTVLMLSDFSNTSLYCERRAFSQGSRTTFMQPSVSASRPLRPYLLSSGVSYEGELSCPGVQHHLDAALCTPGEDVIAVYTLAEGQPVA